MNIKSKRQLKIWYTVVLTLVLAGLSSAVSLWQENNLFSSRKNLNNGDILKIVFDSKSVIKYRAEMKHGGTDKVSLKKPGVNTFNFLPSFDHNATKDNSNRVDYTVEKEFRSAMAVVITAVAPNGVVTFQGQHTMVMNGQQEQINLTGRVSVTDIFDGNSVKAADIAGLNLTYTGPVKDQQQRITGNDLVYPTNASATNGQGANAGKDAPALTEQRKRQLLQAYLNRIANILFNR